MIRTNVTQTLALAGFAPAGKPGYAKRQERSRSARTLQLSGLLWLAGALAALEMAQAQTPAEKEIVLHNFAAYLPGGRNPFGGVIRDSAGNFYGTTNYGGPGGWGVVYKLDPCGRETVLYSFTNGTDGGQPLSGVIRDSDGNLYGTTPAGGTASQGVVYKVDTAGQESVLYNFTGGADGGSPSAGVIRDSDGNFYGTTNGGSAGWGVVYKLDTAGQETVLYTFTGGADGGSPSAGVIRDSDGNLYGTTGGGGAGWGVVYKLDTAGQETVLYTFTGGADGGSPSAGVIRDSAGNFYGTANYGGPGGWGVVYKLDTSGKETVLYTFKDGADGGSPFAGVIRGPDGNLYGTTQYGGTAGAGVVFKLDTAGHETVLHSFTGGADGTNPNAGVIRDSAGNLYGTTPSGGTSQSGVMYKLDAAGHETVLCGFPLPADGSEPPNANVVRDSAGNLYGTTLFGGQGDAGVVFKVDPAGHETLLHSFTGGADGNNPNGVILDSAGNIYGTTSTGGTTGQGLVFKLDPAGVETVLYTFTGGADGRVPAAGVIRDSAGNLYGTTELGGAVGAGVVFKLDTANQETVLYNFTNGSDGGYPESGVIRCGANLYGTTQSGGAAGAGVVFKLDGAGQYTVIYTFTGGADGRSPYGLTCGPKGSLYGTTFTGGGAGVGVVFELSAAGQETVLYSFTGGADGAYPVGVIRDSAGNLYGAAAGGGTTANAGVVFKLDTAGHQTVLYTFTGKADGNGPNAVIRDAAGNLYGTTYSGGKNSGGVVFKLIPR